MIIPGYKIKNAENYIRAGVIPYIVNKGRLYILLARDRKTMEICDFGGGVKKYENCFEGALREFNEETCGIFSKEIDVDDLKYSIAVCNSKNTHVIFFVRINPDWYYFAINKFHKTIKYTTKLEKLENDTIFWVEHDDFIRLFQDTKSKKVWFYFKRFIVSHGNGIHTFFKQLLLLKHSKVENLKKSIQVNSI